MSNEPKNTHITDEATLSGIRSLKNLSPAQQTALRVGLYHRLEESTIDEIRQSHEESCLRHTLRIWNAVRNISLGNHVLYDLDRLPARPSVTERNQ